MNELYSASPIEWKVITFGEEIGPANNVISIGDSDFERAAVMALLKPGRFVKSLKLDTKPSPEKLLQQFVMLRGILNAIVQHAANMDIICNSLTTVDATL